ncbi:unnamed protein product [Schistosoma curassoni]|uniref:Cadherin domain-containing protein n=1 Tax=Schistosoma curassoni TaxID=6186 RepID=A0A183JEU3_9TREM|nr:unnamed protein product [Schistosoma curassoni]
MMNEMIWFHFSDCIHTRITIHNDYYYNKGNKDDYDDALDDGDDGDDDDNDNDHHVVVGGRRQESLDPGFVLLGTHQQGVSVFLRELVLPDGFDPASSSFTVRDVTTELSELRLNSINPLTDF